MLDLHKFCLGLNLSQDDHTTVSHLAGLCNDFRVLPSDWRSAESSFQHIYYYNSKSRQATWSHPIEYVLAIIVRDIKSLPPSNDQACDRPAIGPEMLHITDDYEWLVGLINNLSITLGSGWGWIRCCVSCRSIDSDPEENGGLRWFDCIEIPAVTLSTWGSVWR